MVLTRSGDYAKALNKAKAVVADSIVEDENLLGAESELLYLTGDHKAARAALQQAVDSGRTELREYRAANLLLTKLKA
jgi:hypothetical protein